MKGCGIEFNFNCVRGYWAHELNCSAIEWSGIEFNFVRKYFARGAYGVHGAVWSASQ